MKRVRKKEISPLVLKVGNRIKEIILEKNLKLMHVAYDADLDVANLRKYIKGSQEMKISTMMRIVNALNIKIEELFDKKD